MRDSFSLHLNRTFKATEAIVAMNKVCREIEYQFDQKYKFELIDSTIIGALRDGAQVPGEYVSDECSSVSSKNGFLMPPYIILEIIIWPLITSISH